MLKILIPISIFFISVAGYAERILLIGDSHSCGTFGLTLVKELSAKGNSVTLFCMVSSAPRNWVKGTNPPEQICQTVKSPNTKLSLCENGGQAPTLDSILSQDKYDSAILAMGTNSLAASSVDSSYKEMAQKVSNEVSSCYWVGPPHLRPDQAKGFSTEKLALMEENNLNFYSSLQSAVGNSCRLLGSLKITSLNAKASETADGVHRTKSSGMEWALEILRATVF